VLGAIALERRIMGKVNDNFYHNKITQHGHIRSVYGEGLVGFSGLIENFGLVGKIGV
jgi:hypothetical protein